MSAFIKKNGIILLIGCISVLGIFLFVGMVLLNIRDSDLARSDNRNTNSKTDSNGRDVPKNPSSYVAQFDSMFYKKYINESVENSTKFPIDSGAYANNYNHYNFTVDKSIPVEVFILNASQFTSVEGLYKKMYMALSPTGNYLESYSYSDTKITTEMALVEPAIGGKTYMLIGGIIENERAYYFQILIGDAIGYNIKENDIQNIVMFNHARNTNEVLNLITQFTKEDIPLSYFKEFVPANADKAFDNLPKGNFNLPEAQDRN